jgi:hypothetical protein
MLEIETLKYLAASEALTYGISYYSSINYKNSFKSPPQKFKLHLTHLTHFS